MRRVSEYLRLIIFVLGVLLGVQIPGFVNDYGESLRSRFEQSRQDIARFQEDAKKYFGGDEQKLIEHYKNSSDEIVRKGGDNLQIVFAKFTELTTALNNFQGSRLAAYTHVFLNPISDIRRSVWQNYTHLIPLNTEALVVGVGMAFVLTLGVDLVLGALMWLFSVIFASSAKSSRQQL